MKNTDYVKRFDLTNDEIKNIIDIFPTINDMDFKRIKNNIDLVVEYGYPEEDLAFLLNSNPGFLAWSAKGLEDRLNEICSEHDDLEEALKKDPFLI